jgi:hypothetical protein
VSEILSVNKISCLLFLRDIDKQIPGLVVEEKNDRAL